MIDTIIRYMLNILKISIGNKKYKLKLLLELNKLLQKEKQNNIVIQEIFRMYFNINLSSKQISELSKDDNAIVIIEYLKKFPNILIYKNKKLNYTRNYQQTINKTYDIIWYISSIFFIIIIALSSYIAITDLNIQQAIIAIILIVFIIIMYNYKQDFKKLDDFILRYK